MRMIPGKHIGTFAMLPARPGACPECAVKHDPKLPHDQQSLFYQYKFFGDNVCWPSWEDAMAHCSDEMKEAWRWALREQGVEI